MFDFLEHVEDYLVDDLGEEDADAPEEDCGEVGADDVGPVHSAVLAIEVKISYHICCLAGK